MRDQLPTISFVLSCDACLFVFMESVVFGMRTGGEYWSYKKEGITSLDKPWFSVSYVSSFPLFKLILCTRSREAGFDKQLDASSFGESK